MLRGELEKVSDLSITTDCWTSKTNIAFMIVTVHFSNGDWSLQSRVLETHSDKKRHTTENLHNELVDVFKSWNIEKNVTVVVSDNAKNIKNAVGMCQLRQHGCFAHTLNLAVRDSIKSMKM